MSSTNVFPTPAFIEAAKLTRPKTSLRRVYVYVEDDIDIVFWRSFLNDEEYGCVFVISVYKVADKEIRGKDAMMKDYLSGRLILSSSTILCLDSDLDLIIGDYHTYTKHFRQSPYIINTIWYSIENIKCHYSNIKSMLYKVSLAESIIVDVKAKMLSVSLLISRLFLICLVSYKLKDNYYSLDDFGKVLDNIKFKENGDLETQAIDAINNDIMSKSSYEKRHNVDIVNIKQLLENQGYSNSSYLQIIRGHDYADKIVKSFIKTVGGHIRELRLKAVGGSKVERQYKIQLNQQYSNQTGVTKNCCFSQRIEDLIRDSYDFTGLPVYNTIKTRIEKALVNNQVTSILNGLIDKKYKDSSLQ